MISTYAFNLPWKVMGCSQAYDFSTAFGFDVGETNVPLGVTNFESAGLQDGPE